MRYERKFRLSGIRVDEAQHHLQMNPAHFFKQFPDRQVNSIYFDDTLHSNVHANLSGVTNRNKYRIRWYGKNIEHPAKPVLENKIKRGELGYKEYSPIQNFSSMEKFEDYYLGSNLAGVDLFPVVSVHYIRSYFISFDRKVRATIDRHVHYRSIEQFSLSRHSYQDDETILEVKYDELDADKGESAVQSVPFSLGKNSKYVRAVQCILF